MATNSQIPFNPQGKTIFVAADVAAPAGVQAPVSGPYVAMETGQVRIVNASANTVHLGVGSTAAIAQTNAVAAAAGVPALGVPLLAGAVEILRFSPGVFFSGVSSAASSVFITPGQGL